MKLYKNFILGSASALALAIASASNGPSALAASANVSTATVNTLDLLSPFLTLNSTTVGQQTLTANLAQAVAINQNAASVAAVNGYLGTPTLAALAISDENLLGPASNTVYGIPATTTFGVAANLAGGLPAQNTTSYGTTVNGAQTTGGFGSILGAAFVKDVGSAGSPVTLPNTVNLLTTALCFTGNTLCNGATTSTGDASVAKFYFANGTWNGAAATVAPAGSTLPTYAGLPNATSSVYDTAYGVTNTQAGQNAYGDSHPYQTYSQISATYTLYDPTVKTAYNTSTYTNAINPDKPSTNPAFPSSHMAYAETDSILLGMMVPQLYQSMLLRASEMGESRIVVGVHYPTDIIASRAFSAYDLVQYLSNPSYINNAATTGTAVNLPSLLGAATGEIQTVMTAAASSASCGTSLATCATSAANVNPYAPSATNAAIYAARMTYGLPTLASAPAELTDANGLDASILLVSVYGGGTAAAKSLMSQMGLTAGMYGDLSTATIQQIIANTESSAFAAFYGTQLSYWSRLNLYAAIGYFQNVTGALTLQPADTVTTPVTIGNTGDLINNGAIVGQTLVTQGGALGGAGLIVGATTIASGGVLAPGSAAGNVLTIRGALTFNSGSTLAIAATPAAATGVAVNGQTQINGAGVAVTTSAGTYAASTTYTLLTATGGVSGQFTGVTGAASNFTPILSYDADDVYLSLARNDTAFAAFARTPNQSAVGQALSQAFGNLNWGAASSTQASILNAVDLAVNAGQAPTALDALSGAGIAAANQAALDAGAAFAGSISDQAYFGLFGAGPDASGVSHYLPAAVLAYAGDDAIKSPIAVKGPLPAPERDWRAWGLFLGGGSNVYADSSRGTAASNSSGYGGLAGLDYRLQPNWLVGLALGGGSSSFSVNSLATSGNVSGFHAGLYTAYALNQGYYAELSGTFGSYHNGTTRYVGLATVPQESLSGSFASYEERVRLEFGRAISFHGSNVTPFVAGEFASLQSNAFTETAPAGIGALALSTAAQTTISAPIFVGFKLFGSYVVAPDWTAAPDLTLAWVHEFSRDRKVSASLVSLPGTDFTVLGPLPASDLAQVKAGVRFAGPRGVTLFADFNGEFSPSSTSYGGKGGIQVAF